MRRYAWQKKPLKNFPTNFYFEMIEYVISRLNFELLGARLGLRLSADNNDKISNLPEN